MKLNNSSSKFLYGILDKCVPLHKKLKPQTRVYYYKKTNNFGDMLNKFLWDRYQGDYTFSKPFFSEWICIGSILDSAFITKRRPLTKRPLHVWGSGFLQPPTGVTNPFTRPLIIHALRGKLTRDCCAELTGQDLSGIALGDPGLLIPRLFPEIKVSHSKKVGIIAHQTDEGCELFKQIDLGGLPHTFINISDDAAKVVAQIADCGMILSSGLHPLICADSLGIPNKHIIVGDRLTGGSFKFRDYDSAFTESQYAPVDVREQGITPALIERWRDEYKNRREEAADIGARLLAALPPELRISL